MKGLILSTLFTFVTFFAFSQAPITPSSNLIFNYFDGNQLRFSLTKGDGAKRLIIAKAGSQVTSTPADGTDYIAGNFGLGNEIAPGEFVVYEGIGYSNIYISGLSHSTTYYFKIFEFNGGNSTTEYLTSSFLEGSQVTLTYPTVQAASITFTNVLAETMTVNWTKGDGSGRILIGREGTPVNAEPNDLVNYSAHPGAMGNASYQIGLGNYVLYNSTGTSANITSLKLNTTYYFALYEYNGSSGKVFLTSTSPVSTPGATANQTTPAYPTINSTNVWFDSPQVDYLRGRMSGYGNGARRIMVVKKDSPVDALPVDGMDYTPNTTFGSGSNLGNDNFVVYDGAGGNYLHLYGLQANTTYHVKVFEYNGAGSTTSYLTGTDSNGNPPPESSLATLSSPTVQASDIAFTNVLGTKMTVNFTKGDGAGRILIASEGRPVDVEPVDLLSYSPSGAGMGNASYQIGIGNYVLYSSTGTTANITNLKPNTTYYFALFEYNGTASSRLYLTSASPVSTPGATANQLTPAYPTVNSTTVWFDSPQVDYLRGRISGYGNGAKRIMVVKKDSPVDAIPVDGMDYIPNTTFGSGSNLGNDNFVVYDGTGGNYLHLYGLQANTTYHVKVFEYNGAGSTTSYLTGNDSNGNPPPEGSLATLSSPSVQASNIAFTNVLGTKMTVNFTKGDGAGRILVASENRPVDVEPVDLVSYNANSAGMSNASYQIGIGNYVLYNSTGTSVNITNLKPNTTYYFALFEYNGTASSRLYLTSASPVSTPGATANQLTPAYPTINSASTWFDSQQVDYLRGRISGYGNGARRIMVVKKDSPVDGLPVDGQEYTPNTTFGLGSNLGNDNFVVYDGTAGNYLHLYGLEPNSTYHLKVFEYNGTGSETFYLRGNDINGAPPAEGSQSTVTYPVTQASNILFTNVLGDHMSLNWTNGTGVGRILIAREGSPVDAEPVDLLNYSASTTGIGNASYEIGTGNYVLYTGTGSQVNITNLTPNRTYYFALFEYSGGTKKLYLTSTSPVSTPGATASRYAGTPPTSNTTNVTFNTIDGDRFKYNFSKGGGDNRIVVVREGNPVNANPVDEQAYIANITFGAGDDLGGGNYVVYNGNTAPSGGFRINGLNHSSTYYIKVFEYNGYGTETYYLTVSDLNNNPPGEGGQATKTYPSTQASNILFTDVSGSAMQVNWANGDGEGRILIGRKGSPVDVEPSDFGNYNANSAGMGNVSYEIGSGNYVLYNGSGTNTHITNLELNSNYHFALFEFNGYDGKVFLTSSSITPKPGATAQQSTTTYPSYAASNIFYNEIDGNRFRYNYTKGDGTHRLVIAKQGNPVDVFPVDGQEYNDDDTYGLGQDLGNGNYVLYNGTGSYSFINGLNPSTTYYLKVFEYNKEGIQTYYLVSSYLQGNQNTLSAPTIQASDIVVHGKSANSIDLSWTEGNGSGSMLIARAGGPVDVDPTDLTSYSASAYGMGNSNYEIGNGNYVIFSRLNSNTIQHRVDIQNLLPNINYHFALFEFSGDFGKLYLKPAYTFQEQTWGLRPTLQTSNAFLEDGATSMSVKFQSGNGLFTLVLGKVGSPVDVDPTDFTSYNSYGFVPEAEIGNGNFVVFDSKNGGDEFDLSNLTQDETYHFSFYEYAISESGELYLTPGYTGFQSTSTPPTLLPTNLTVDPPCGNNIQVSWDINLQDPNTGDGRLVVLSKEPLNTVPMSTVDYSADFDYGEGSPIGNGFVVYKGSGVLFPPNLLEVNTNYYINLFEYNGVDTDPAFNPTPVQGLIGDDSPPTVLCKNITVQLDINGVVSILPEDVDNGSTDDCTLKTLSLDITDFTCDEIGENTVTLTATDSYGNTSSCEAKVIVEDSIVPELTTVEDKSEILDTNCAFIIPDYTGEINITDNCATAIPTITQLPLAGTVITGNETLQEIILTADDGNGNTASTSFNIALVDNIVPTLDAVADKIEETNANCVFIVPDYTGLTNASDNCGTPTMTQLPLAGTEISGNGTIQEIILTADDGNGNTAATSFNITLSDKIAPTLTAVADQSEETDENCSFTIPNYTALSTTTDNCSATITVTQSPIAGTVITGNETLQEIILTADDGNGNTASTSFNIALVDNIVPTLDAVADKIEETNANCVFIVPDYTGLTNASDNCGTPTMTQLPLAGTEISGNGTIQEIILTADDGNGNTAATSFNITLSDKIAPTLTAVADQSEETDENCSFTIPNYTALSTTTDNCSATITVTQSPIAGTVITGNGTVQEIVLTADDGNGNITSTSFNITLFDNVAPTLTAVTNQNEETDANCVFIIPDYTSLTNASDNCGTPTIIQSPLAGTVISSSGTIQEIILTADDGHGNTATTSFHITLSDNVAPTLTAVTDQSEETDENCSFTIPDYTGLTNATDNCGTPTVSQTPAVGTLISGNGATQTITLTANDGNGNDNSIAFDVTLVDNILPTIIGLSANINANNDATVCGATIIWTEPTSIDNCSGSTVAQTAGPANGSVFPIGTTNVTYTATDGSSNTYSESFDVIVTDNENPTITTVVDFEVNPDSGCDFMIPDYTSLVSISDNCGLPTLSQSPSAGTIMSGHASTQIITITTNDGNGNTNSTSFIITLLGTTTFYADTDGDGFGDPNNTRVSCSFPAGYVFNNTDCNDTDPTIQPNAIEVCDGIDNNCDGSIDEGLGITYYVDADGDGYGDATISMISCNAPSGYVNNSSDCNDSDANVNPGATEILYNGIDDDCNSATEDGTDADGDGYGSDEDCNDNDAAINPSAFEVCDGVDNNCDGTIDEGVTSIFYADADSDGYGDAAVSVQACSAPTGFVTDNTDCNDNDAAINPSALEVCDGIDNNCDGSIDEGLGITYYVDADGDGYGDATISMISCNAPSGYVNNSSDCNDSDANVNPGATEILYNGIDDDCNSATEDGTDADGDGYGRDEDCNDNDAAINPSAFEVCDGVDNNCDGTIDEGVTSIFYADADSDGYGDAAVSVQACSAPTGFVTDNTDCNDNDAAINPSAIEVCDGIDNNCDGSIDEGLGITYYVDADGDGYGDATISMISCNAPSGYVTNSGDCNDSDANVNPGATEILYNGIDDDCNSATEDGTDADGDGYGSDEDCDDDNAAINPGVVEVCDGIDNNCDGSIDEGLGITYYVDADGDGYGDATISMISCNAPSGYVNNSSDCNDLDANVNPGATEILYNGIDDDCNSATEDGTDADGDGYGSDEDCNDNDAAINPSALEVCDGVDNNCDGTIDEGVTSIFYADADSDGYGDAAVSVQACSAPTGFVTDNTDCNDNDAAINPSAIEVCDGIDNNCDGSIDEGLGITYYVDADGDGYGDATISMISCNAPSGYVNNSSDCNDSDANVNPGATEILYNGIDDDCNSATEDGTDADGDGYGSDEDCDDDNAAINPGVVEVCDGIDNNCDGSIDEGLGITYYVDADGDGYGDATISMISCNAPSGYVNNSSDCNDSDANVNPGATEILYNGIDDDCNSATEDGTDADGDGYGRDEDCNDNDAAINPSAFEVCDGVDNNCDGTIDEGVTSIFYADADSDGYGDAAVSVQACSAPTGFVTDNTDCNDNDAAINPSALEVCDGIDNNCDGSIDEGLGITYYVDADGDGYGDATISMISCNVPSGYVNNSSDCNDSDANVNPGATEILYNGIDDDCNSATEDGTDADGDGYGSDEDCNDNDAAINPSAFEVCDGVDNNCDGTIDEGVTSIFYADADSDGYGDAAVSVQACSAPTGFVTDNTDCNDNDAAINPSAIEVCDGIDNDCDGAIDEEINSGVVPEISMLSLPVDPIEVGMKVSATANYTGDNPPDASFEWGDGETSIGNINGGIVEGSHNYQMPGVYTVSLTLTDNCGNTDTEIYQYVVVYDPSGGFVTGGGWIWSAPGNYLEDPSLEGKANFGFVAKYKKGAKVPDGNTIFKFKAGDLSFKSVAYEWLVVAGIKAKYKGVGTINGNGNYQFMLSAVDGDSKNVEDKFRIKIWTEAGDTVYDNQPGQGDDEDATTIISGGSITIHTGKNKNARIASVIEKEVIIEEAINVYPNPFSKYINVSFELLNDAQVTVSIFDLNGKIVSTLNEATLMKGIHNIKWDGISNSGNLVSNGVYIVSIKTRGYESMKRVIFEGE